MAGLVVMAVFGSVIGAVLAAAVWGVASIGVSGLFLAYMAGGATTVMVIAFARARTS